LAVCSIPPLEIVTGDGGAAEITVNDDPFSHLPLAGVARLPLAITLSKVAVGHAAPSSSPASSAVVGGAEWILDATSDEEQCSSVRLTLSLSPEGRLAGLSKGGVGTINLQALDAIMAHAAPLGVQLHKLIQQQVNKSKGIHAATDGAEPAPVPVASPEAPASSKSASKKKKQQKQQAMEE
jgi:exosome complex RNA-binding protein Rrp42 (RNase PH superfamily)